MITVIWKSLYLLVLFSQGESSIQNIKIGKMAYWHIEIVLKTVIISYII